MHLNWWRFNEGKVNALSNIPWRQDEVLKVIVCNNLMVSCSFLALVFYLNYFKKVILYHSTSHPFTKNLFSGFNNPNFVFRYRQSRFYDQNRVRFQPTGTELGRFTASPRLADAIAMGDVGPTKASKYMAISTPMRNTPDIRLTSPSILGGSPTPYSKDPTNNYRTFASNSFEILQLE